jgi:hypothetical protein
MKTSSVSVQIAAGVALALLSFGLSSGHAASATPLQIAVDQSAQSSPFQQISWEQVKIEKLQHAYHLLKHADGDYGGHRDAAMKSIQEAAEVLGVQLEGKEHAEESQWKSDRRLREARRLLKELVAKEKTEEHPHIRHAIKELNEALAIK